MSYITAGLAIAGAASQAIGAFSKQQGIQQNNAAQGQIFLADLAREADRAREANEIAKWYGGASEGVFNNTLATAGPNAYVAARDRNQADRVATGTALLAGAEAPTNATALAPDASGATKQDQAYRMAEAIDRAQKFMRTGARISSFGDASTETGFNLARGQQDQSDIGLTGKLRQRLNAATHTPLVSSSALYGLAGQAGQSAWDTGSMIQAGGNILSAVGSSGAAKGAWDGLFRGPVGATGPQQPGALWGFLPSFK